MRLTAKHLVPFFSAVAVLLALPGAAHAIDCGDTLNKDLTLKKNLDCASTDGLEVGKSGITIDLNGHTIEGPGGSYNGIDNANGKDRVTIKNGTIRDFSYGAYLYNNSDGGPARNTISNVTFRENGYGVNAYQASGLRLVGNEFLGGTYGAYLYNGGGDDILNNVFEEQTSYALYDYYADGETIEGNTSKGLPSQTYGFYISYSADSVLRDNVANGGSYGFSLQSMHGSRVERAKASNNSNYGIYITDNDPRYNMQVRLSRSTANKNAYGIYSSYSGGAPGKGNKATGNTQQDCYQVRCNG